MDFAQVMIILEELGLPYKSHFVKLEDGLEDYTDDINPTSTFPAITDHNNNNLTLFESGAIISYLIAHYDKSYSLSSSSSRDSFDIQQWTYFQASRQRCYLEDALFTKDEKFYDCVTSLLAILDDHLSRHTEACLFGYRCTYADLAYVIGNARVPLILKGSSRGWDPAEYPHFTRWQEAMMARDSVKHVLSVMGNAEVKSDGRI